MKKLMIIIAVAALHCGVAHAQFGNLLNQAKEIATKAAGGNTAVENAIDVISSKLIPNSTQIVGTWVYQEPAVMLTSTSSIKEYASSIATKSLEQKFQTYLSRVGINKGKASITFNEDKSFSIKYGTKVVKKGTYTLDGDEVRLTFSGKSSVSKITPQLKDGSLVVVADATSFKNFMQNVGAKFSQFSTIVSALKQMDGLMIGARLAKE